MRSEFRKLLKAHLFFFVALLAACTTPDDEKPRFEDLMTKEEVVLVLSDYDLNSIPKEVELLKNAKTLRIVMDSANIEGFTMYPPLSAGGPTYGPEEPTINFLPKEITSLKKLQKLSIIGLGIQKLPENFSNLENLEVLDLSMNKLNISSELPELQKLKKLKYIGLLGNHLDTLQIKHWQTKQPGLQIDYELDFEYTPEIINKINTL